MPICPECRDEKHLNCTGFAFHPVSDERVPCSCFVCQLIDKKESKND